MRCSEFLLRSGGGGWATCSVEVRTLQSVRAAAGRGCSVLSSHFLTSQFTHKASRSAHLSTTLYGMRRASSRSSSRRRRASGASASAHHVRQSRISSIESAAPLGSPAAAPCEARGSLTRYRLFSRGATGAGEMEPLVVEEEEAKAEEEEEAERR